MKIMHILSTNKISGAENVVIDIISLFDDSVEMIYCSPYGKDFEDLKNKGITFTPIKKLTYRNLKKVIKQFKPNIIHAHDLKASVLAARFSSKDIKVISHIHKNDPKLRRISLKGIIFKFLTRKIDKFIFVSQEAYDDYRYKRKRNNQEIVLRNVINTNRIYKNVDPIIKGNYFHYLGRLSYEKNPIRIAEISSKVLLENITSKFYVIGDGPLKKEMEEIFINNNVLERVVFTGNIKNPFDYVYNSSCLFMASYFEGLPLAALESMSLGVPIVSTPTDGLRTIINKQNGFLSNDDLELANKISYYLSLDDMSKRNQKESIVDNFNSINNMELYIDNIKKIYFKSRCNL